jgi:hypothetical protein
MVDGQGVQPCVVGDLPPQCAVLKLTDKETYRPSQHEQARFVLSHEAWSAPRVIVGL